MDSTTLNQIVGAVNGMVPVKGNVTRIIRELGIDEGDAYAVEITWAAIETHDNLNTKWKTFLRDEARRSPSRAPTPTLMRDTQIRPKDLGLSLKLTKYNGTNNQCSTWFTMFESNMHTLGIGRSQWILYLDTSFTGKAARVYTVPTVVSASYLDKKPSTMT
ncbi:Uncharacterized protein PBTT_04389 [Plasmodiophora brassicae]